MYDKIKKLSKECQACNTHVDGQGFRKSIADSVKEMVFLSLISSWYNPSLNNLIERSVRTLKDL